MKLDNNIEINQLIFHKNYVKLFFKFDYPISNCVNLFILKTNNKYWIVRCRYKIDGNVISKDAYQFVNLYDIDDFILVDYESFKNEKDFRKYYGEHIIIEI